MANKKRMGAGGSVIQVNTTAVRNTVTTLTTLNNGMDQAFDSVTHAMSSLNSNWDGSASSKAMSKFNRMKSDFMGNGGRKAVMRQYIEFLAKVVADDYDTTENTNTSLANLFK